MLSAFQTGTSQSTRPLLLVSAVGLLMQAPLVAAQGTGPCDFDRDGVNGPNCSSNPGNDCDDLDPNRFPGNAEVCDADDRDEDCDPGTFGIRDTDNDGFIDAQCCNDSGAGPQNCGDDCNDLARTIHPLASDFCNGVDENCDGEVDDARQSPAATATYVDVDGDGYGNPGLGAHACIGDPGFAAIGGDCDDANPAVVPGALLCGLGGQDTASARVCRSDGTLVPAACGDGAVCVSQPNGLGVCQLEKPKQLK